MSKLKLFVNITFEVVHSVKINLIFNIILTFLLVPIYPALYEFITVVWFIIRKISYIKCLIKLYMTLLVGAFTTQNNDHQNLII